MGSSDDVNRANAQTAQEVFVAWQVLPRLNRRRDTLNSKLLPLFGGADRTVEFDYDDPSPVNAETAATELLQKAQAAQALLAGGIFDPHDVLEAVGLPDMDVQDVPAAATPATPRVPPPNASELGDQGQNRGRPVIIMRSLRDAAKTAPAHDLTAVDTAWKKAVAVLSAAWIAQVVPAQRAQLAAQIKTAVDSGNIAQLADLAVDSAPAAALLLTAMTKMSTAAGRQAAKEAAAQGADDTGPQTADQDTLSDIADATAALAAAQLALSAGGEATRLSAGGDADGQDVADAVDGFLDDLSDDFLTGRLSGAMSAAQNAARIDTFLNGPMSADLYASELMDRITCGPCTGVNGEYIGNTADSGIADAVAALYPNGGYVNCAGGSRCRGTVIADYGIDRGADNRTGPGVRAAKDPAAKVFQQEAEDYPPAAMAWMHHAAWSGPTNVPVVHIDWTPAQMDGASPERVQHFVAKLRAGKKLKPVVLVKTPGAAKLQLVDGHHRYLAAAELGAPVRAFIGVVDADHGPWETMHDLQYPDPDRGAVANAATLSKAAVHFGPSDTPGRRCGTCAMFRPDVPGGQAGTCTLVKGRIASDQVCDRWSSAGTELAALLKRILSNGHVPVETAGRH